VLDSTAQESLPAVDQDRAKSLEASARTSANHNK
jgi:hypothetical protein